MPGLSKSRLLAHRQCQKRLWLQIYKPELLPVTESMQNRGRQLSNLFDFFIIRRPKAGIPASKHLFQFAVEYPCPHLQE